MLGVRLEMNPNLRSVKNAEVALLISQLGATKGRKW